MSSPFEVPGEDLPATAWVGSLATGLACAAAALVLSRPAEASPPPPPPPPVAQLAAAPPPPPPPAPEPRPEATGCPELSIAFGNEATTPLEEDGPILAALATFLTSHPKATLVLHGHADARGSEIENLRLSKARAAAVAAVLTSRGIAPERVTTQGFGAFQPTPGRASSDGVNRRVVAQLNTDAKTSECPLAKETQR